MDVVQLTLPQLMDVVQLTLPQLMEVVQLTLPPADGGCLLYIVELPHSLIS